MSGSISADPLFLGLTRPPMILGASFTFTAVNVMVTLLTFIITSNFLYILVLFPLTQGAAWFICLKEPRAMELLITKTSKCSICRNRGFHGGTNSYDVY